MRRLWVGLFLCMPIAFTACGGAATRSDAGVPEQEDASNRAEDAGDRPEDTFTVGGVVSGLIASELVLRNGSDELTIHENGTFTFAAKLPTGSRYDVEVQSQPTGLTCSVMNGSGVIATADIATIQVSCRNDVYLIGGTVSGLVGTVVLGLNDGLSDGQSVTVMSGGPFSFPRKVPFASHYVVTVTTSPASPSQTCTITQGMGTVGTANISDVAVDCVTNTYVIGGLLSGVAGSGLTLLNNGVDDLQLSSDGPFVFTNAIESGRTYDVTVAAQPTNPTQECVVTGGAGTVDAHAVTSATVICTTSAFFVGGAVSGLHGELILETNGESLTLDVDGAFAFTNRLDSGVDYAVRIKTQPAGQTCAITGGSGTVTAHDEDSVQVTCVPNLYVLGGVVNGLLSGTLKLQLNAGSQTKTLSTNGQYTFDTAIAFGTPYTVTIGVQPDGQTCALSNDSSTMPASDITNVNVTCTVNAYLVGGTVSGLRSGTTVALQTEGGNSLDVGNGPFTFPTALPFNSNYIVAVTSPTGQTCVVTPNSLRTIPAHDVTDVAVSCTPNKYFLGGTVSGLVSGTVTLRLNGSETIALSANNPFSFITRIAFGADYAVSILTQPTGQTCVVSDGDGTMPAAPVTGLVVRCSPKTYLVGGTVSGLAGTLMLQLNGVQTRSLTSNGTFSFPAALPFGQHYAVTVLSQPQSPTQTCTIANMNGTVDAVDITTINVNCTTNQYAIGGAVSGLAGTGLRLQNNGGEELNVTANGTFTFGTAVTSGKSYAVTISQQPSNVTQRCDVLNGVGMVTNGAISDVLIVCSTSAFGLGGSLSGLAGTVVLQSNGQELSLSTSGAFAFVSPVESGTDYSVTVKTQPVGQTCTITNGAGRVTSGPISSVQVTCVMNLYPIGGTLSGLLSGTLVLQLNGGSQTKTMTANGNYAFDSVVTYGTQYSVTLGPQPAGQTCTVSNASSTVPASPVTNVNVSCSAKTYTVGGTVTGLLAGNSVVLQISPLNQVTVSSNTTFTLPTALEYQSIYTLSIATQPTGQNCSVTTAMPASVPASNVTTIGVSCATNAYRIGGTISGLSLGNAITLQLSPSDRVTVMGPNTTFTFPNPLTYNSTYTPSILTQPAHQSCAIAPGTTQSVPASDVTSLSVTCTCADGYLSYNGTCEDINECDQEPPVCGVGTCSNSEGSFSCSCPNGYALTNGTCSEIDECASINGICGVGTCTNTPGAYNCSCPTGYDFTNGTCTEINYCLPNNGGCDVNAACTSANGSRTCACLPGFFGDGFTCTRRYASVATSVDAKHTCGVLTDGTLWCWGYNALGQLGDGTTTDRKAPVQIGTARNWKLVAVSAYHTCGTRTDGTLWCWGNNDYGQLGDGTTTGRISPIQIGSAMNWSTVAAGAYHTCGTRTDRTLWCWGDNSAGQLGDGTTTLHGVPMQAGTATNWSVIAAGATHTCGIRTDSTLWCWGDNTSGRLGDGTSFQRPSPVQISGSATWRTIAPGYLHSCGVRTNGTLWCWGGNSAGQLGDGSTTGHASPTQVGTSTSWNTLVSGGFHACATRTDGSLWCWGRNDYGQLGDGTAVNRTVPVKAGTATNWSTFAASSSHTCGLRLDGSLWCSGSNDTGQLGIGQLGDAFVLSPVQAIQP